MATTATRPQPSKTAGSGAPASGPAKHLGTALMTREAILKGIGFHEGIYSRLGGGNDITYFRIGARRYVAVTHPDLVEHILYTGVDNYPKGADYKPLNIINGLSLFSDNGESWRRHRMMLNPMFSKRHLNTVFDPMVAPITSAVAALPQEPAEIEIAEEMVKLTLEVVGAAVFNESFARYFPQGTAELISVGLRNAFWFGRVFMVAEPSPAATNVVTRLFHSRVPMPPPVSTVRTHAREVHDAIDAIIEDRAKHPTDAADLLNLVLAARDEEGSMTPQRVRAELITAMLAGHETTANALAWTFYLLSLNPGARERLQEEVDTVLQGRPPTLDDLTKLPWTTACLEEGMRYYPPAYMQSRVALNDDVIGGHEIKAGTTVWIPAYQIHHDSRWWDNPEVYDPSRFLPGADADRPRCAYVPFSGGRRVCIGRSLAMMEMVLIMAMFNQSHTFDLVPGFNVEPETNFTLRPRHGVRMLVRPRG